MIIFGFPSVKDLARSVAKKIRCKYGKLEVKKFPDGESYIRFLAPVKNEVVAIFNDVSSGPDSAIVQSIFAVETARELGAKKTILVMPYLPYLRQDKRFKRGECVSAVLMAKLLSSADTIVTVNPHLHRIERLSKIFRTHVANVDASQLLGYFVRKKIEDPVVVGPDVESHPIATKVAIPSRAPMFVLKKKRLGPRDVKIRSVDNVSMRGHNVVIADDIISTGSTVLNAIKLLKKEKPRSISVVCIHGIFLEGALKKIKKAGARIIASTNTFHGKTAALDISHLIAQRLQQIQKVKTKSR